MRSLLTRMRRHRLISALVMVLATGALTAVAVVATEATSEPDFCDSCHEMTPFYAAWNAGPHASVDCVTCHVDPGIVAEMSHKVVALEEVYVHLTGEPRFPGDAEVPDSRCVACHDGDIDPGITGFDHETHSAGKSCVSCHDGVGHSVSSAALAEAGILDAEAYAARESAKVAEVGAGTANLEGHATVVCSSCHDLAATGCTSCHTPPADHAPVAQTCATCHAAGAAWAFSHPASKDCATCHTSPDDHYGPTCSSCHDPSAPFATAVFAHPDASASCLDCHERPAGHSQSTCVTCHETGVSWAFTHPASTSCATCHRPPANHYGSSCSSCHTPSKAFRSTVWRHPASTSTCLDCHTRPAGHSQSSCVTCHQTGVSWRFAHPTSKSCASCHRPPANHYGTSCASCHTPSKAWSSAVWAHPASTSVCLDCHTRPAGHSQSSCVTCHQTGVSWAFKHPTSTSCASCHTAPSNHYGTTCSSCHTPSKAWSSATFTHPGIPGGEHTYRSFTCVSCHPSGYSTYSCLKCHSSNNPDD